MNIYNQDRFTKFFERVRTNQSPIEYKHIIYVGTCVGACILIIAMPIKSMHKILIFLYTNVCGFKFA